MIDILLTIFIVIGIVFFLAIMWALCIVAAKADHEIEENDNFYSDDKRK